VLVPLSFGFSSISLLHVLDLHLKTQRSKTGRTGFEISAVYIQEPGRTVQAEELLGKVRAQYPDHDYASLPLHDVFRLVPDDASLKTLMPRDENNADSSTEEQLANMINSLTSATARADVISTLRTRLIVEHAKLTDCESILWGDSTTTLKAVASLYPGKYPMANPPLASSSTTRSEMFLRRNSFLTSTWQTLIWHRSYTRHRVPHKHPQAPKTPLLTIS
jgi:hypothetical protein